MNIWGGSLSKNKQIELERFTKNKTKKKGLIFSCVFLVLLVGFITLYRTFALYEEKLEFNLIQGKVPEYTSGDVKFASIIDGEKSSTIPAKNDGYVFVSAECDNGADAMWDSDNWRVSVGNLSKSKTTCTLMFETKDTTKLNGNIVNSLLSIGETDELAYDRTTDNNLRYIGANPNNYILFNNELWRIIGVMNNVTDSNGNKGSRIKIIRNESIGLYYWSGSSSNESNDWTKSTLNTGTLNGTYYNGLTSVAKNMISSVVWNLGGRDTPYIKTSEYYELERGTNVYNGNAITWTGKIAIIYQSDYGFAVGGNVRENCLNTNISSYYSSCKPEDWLYTC